MKDKRGIEKSWETTKKDPEAVARRVAGMLAANAAKKAKKEARLAALVSQLCKCGCGGMTDPGRVWIRHHYLRMPRKLSEERSQRFAGKCSQNCCRE
jgi:hypothetical protein